MTTTTFDIAEYLDNKEVIAEYLSQVLADGDMDEFLQAIGHIAKARGMSQIAKDTGLGRESLYKSFRDGGSPKFETVMKVMHSLGVQLRTTA